MDEAWCSMTAGAKILGISRSSFRRMVEAGQLPQGVQFGPKQCRKWLEEDLQNFLRQRIKEAKR